MNKKITILLLMAIAFGLSSNMNASFGDQSIVDMNPFIDYGEEEIESIDISGGSIVPIGHKDRKEAFDDTLVFAEGDGMSGIFEVTQRIKHHRQRGNEIRSIVVTLSSRMVNSDEVEDLFTRLNIINDRNDKLLKELNDYKDLCERQKITVNRANEVISNSTIACAQWALTGFSLGFAAAQNPTTRAIASKALIGWHNLRYKGRLSLEP